MIEFLDVAQFMDDDIVAQVRVQEDQLVIEVEIALLRARAPAALLIPDGDLAVNDAVLRGVMLIEMLNTLMHKNARGFLIRAIERAASGLEDRADQADAADGMRFFSTIEKI